MTQLGRVSLLLREACEQASSELVLCRPPINGSRCSALPIKQPLKQKREVMIRGVNGGWPWPLWKNVLDVQKQPLIRKRNLTFCGVNEGWPWPLLRDGSRSSKLTEKR